MRFTRGFLAIGALCSCISSVSAKDFDIAALRFPKDNCTGKEIGERTDIEDTGRCHTWQDNIPFKSFDYGWSKPRPAANHPEKYGYCTISIWLEEGCHGGSMGDFGDANSERWLGSCISWLDPPPEKAKSMKVTCVK